MQAAFPTILKRNIPGRIPISESILEGFFLAKRRKHEGLLLRNSEISAGNCYLL